MLQNLPTGYSRGTFGSGTPASSVAGDVGPDFTTTMLQNLPTGYSRGGTSAAGTSASGTSASSVVEGLGEGVPDFTTVMLQNLPAGCSREMVAELLNMEGFAGLYDFIYLPADFARGVFFGYVFVNFVSNEAAQCCQTQLQGFSRWASSSTAASSSSAGRACRVSWGDTHQGLSAQVERYRNSPVMHPSVPDHFKPALYARDGSRVPFPPATRRLRPPRIRRAKEVPDNSACARDGDEDDEP
jgi:hypothetical protein